MTTPRLFRVIQPVAEIEAGTEFYAHLLGIPGTRVSSGRHYFDCGGTILACYDAQADGDAKPSEQKREHVYFSVENIDAMHARAAELDCRELTAIEVRPWGERSFYALDPFDNPICFVDSSTLFTGTPA